MQRSDRGPVLARRLTTDGNGHLGGRSEVLRGPLSSVRRCLAVIVVMLCASLPALAESREEETARLLAELDQEREPARRLALADRLLHVQLEPGKTWPEARAKDDCTSIEDTALTRLAYVQLEVERLLAPRIACWLPVVGWGKNYELWDPLREWARHLPLHEQRAFWESVMKQLYPDRDAPGGSRSVARELAWTLMVLASEALVEDPDMAARYMAQAEPLSTRSDAGDVAYMLARMRDHLAWFRDPGRETWTPVTDPARLVGEYGGAAGASRDGTTHLFADGTCMRERWTGDDRTCPGGWTFIHGTWQLRGGRVFMRWPRRKTPYSHPPDFSTEWVAHLPIPWGPRIYLIGEDPRLMIDFCNQVSASRAANARDVIGVMALGAALRVHGVPEVPPAWRDFLLASPVEARVIGSFSSGELAIDAGWRAGMRPGMVLYRAGLSGGDGKFQVKYVMDDVAIVCCPNASNLGDVGDHLCSAQERWAR